MVVYAIILTIVVIGYVAYRVISLFNNDSIETKLRRAEQEITRLKGEYNDVLNQKIDVNNPGDGGMPSGQSVGSVDEL
jgi:hypothetical protein